MDQPSQISFSSQPISNVFIQLSSNQPLFSERSPVQQQSSMSNYNEQQNDIVIPEQAIWAFLNQRSFIEVMEICLSTPGICSISYFQQRLVDRGVNINLYQQSTGPPGVKYIKTLILTNNIDVDPAVAIYVIRTTVLFPGVEQFIGLGYMGIRAIDHNDYVILKNVLKMYPNTFESNKIASELLWRYYQTGYLPNLFPNKYNLRLLINDTFSVVKALLPKLQVELYDFVPRSWNEYKEYMNGLAGGESILYSFAYLSGMIDGGHTADLLKDGLSYGLLDKAIRYAIVRGSPDVFLLLSNIKGEIDAMSIKDKRIHLIDFYKHAVEYNRLTVVDWLFNNLPLNSKIMLYPPTQEMIDLLRSYGVTVKIPHIIIGALKACNYELLFSTPLEIKFSLIREISIVARSPPYMIAYIVQQKAAQTPGLIDKLFRTFGHNRDYYRTEMLLKMGYHPDPRYIQSIKKQLRSNLLSRIYQHDLSMYPLIDIIMV